ncbi:MAG: glycoside hydrolase family 2 TIM barrel-domain containing protein [Cytophagaceae bacterium]
MIRKLLLVILVETLLLSCTEKSDGYKGIVHIRKENGKYVLIRNREPYFIKGAAGADNMKTIKDFGGNSIRTWSTDNAKEILDSAHQYGLTVTLGIYVGGEAQGFNYDNEKEVEEQLSRIKQEVLDFKNHPALLMWGIGNEVDILSSRKRSTNIQLWRNMEKIAKMVKELDPDHPTTTMIVPYRKTIKQIKTFCPSIDILSINTFGELPDLRDKLNEWFWGWEKPYIVSEWGTQGWWEAKSTLWDAPIEETSSKKGEFYFSRYNSSIKPDTNKCIGSYVFYWGNKQEKTHTWFSMFMPDGEATLPVAVMNYLWSGHWPANIPPHLDYVLLDGKGAKENIFLNTGEEYLAEVFASDPENDSLRIEWELLPESIQQSGAGIKEERLKPVENCLLRPEGKKLRITVPDTEGAYRLFVYLKDGHNNAATANIPFYVVGNK